MDDFGKYHEQKSRGQAAGEVYRTARADGLDQVAALRMLRAVFGLSLAEAKQASGAADSLSQPQRVEPGGLVHWEGWTSTEGLYLMKARVVAIENGVATLADHQQLRVTKSGLDEVPLSGPPIEKMPVAHLQKPLAVRMAEVLVFLEELSQINTSEHALP